MTNPTNWPPETGSEWHTHFIWCPHCNHRQQGVGCKRNDCFPPVSTETILGKMERTTCRQCGKEFWFNDGCDPDNYPGEKARKDKNPRLFGTVGDYLEKHDFICFLCGEILLEGGDVILNPWVGSITRQLLWEDINEMGQAVVVCSCGARQLIRVPSGVARVVRKDGAEERWGK